MSPLQREAQKIIQHILEDGPAALVRACAQCEKEHGVLRRNDPNKSHGLCKRHTIQWAREGGLSDAEIQDILRSTEAGSGFVPDLGPVQPVRENHLVRQCAWCYRIYDPETNSWKASRHRHPDATHGICPMCAKVQHKKITQHHKR